MENNMKEVLSAIEGPAQRTSKYIAYILLLVYSICLVGVLYAAYNEAPTSGQIWFELFKSGFLLLGGSLTTVIGHYFGSRGVQQAEESLKIAVREAETSKEEALSARNEAARAREGQASTTDEDSMTPAPEEGAE